MPPTKTFNPESFKFPTNANDFISKAQHLIDVFGNEIKKSFQKKTFTLGIAFGIAFDERLDNNDNVNVFIKANSWIDPALKMYVYPYRDKCTVTIDTVKPFPKLGLTGPYVVELAKEISKLFGASEINLYDGYRVNYDAIDPKCIISETSSCQFRLSWLLMISDRTTFFGQFGFRPREQRGLRRLRSRLCSGADRLRTLTIKDIYSMACQIDKVMTELATAAENPSNPSKRDLINASYIYIDREIIDSFDRDTYPTLASLRVGVSRISKMHSIAKRHIGDLNTRDPDATLFSMVSIVNKNLKCEELFSIERTLRLDRIKNLNGKVVYRNPFFKYYKALNWIGGFEYTLDLGNKERVKKSPAPFCA